MKRIALTLIAILIVAFPLFSQNVEIPDTAFLHALIEEGVDTNGDSLISFDEAEAVTYLDVGGLRSFLGERFRDMSGIEAFINLDTLICRYNQVDFLDLSKCISLKYLDCEYMAVSGRCGLASLDISGCQELTYLNCGNNLINYLDISNNSSLEILKIDSIQFGRVDISVWPAFNPDEIEIDKTGTSSLEYNFSSKPLVFRKRCVTMDSYIEVASSRDGNIYLIPNKDIANGISVSCVTVKARSFVRIYAAEADDYYNLYAVDDDGILSEPLGITLYGAQPDSVSYCITEFGENTSSVTMRAKELFIYPNPTNTLLSIETEYSDHYSINITTLNGQMVFTGEMEGTSHQIDLSTFQKGVYFITIRSQDLVTTRKIIKL